ncbi:MAG: hypothetical protein MUF84_17870, partial [Anaerolineae bacterium]|nr:hypothetical protein [Anaerolineae bacterium]
PVLGEGLGSYMRWHDGHQWQRVFVHNEYLTRFAKFGVVGLLLLLVFLYQCYKHLLGHMLDPRSDARLLATSAAVFIAMMLGFSLFYEFGIFFWVFASLGVSIARTTPSVETAEVPYVP